MTLSLKMLLAWEQKFKETNIEKYWWTEAGRRLENWFINLLEEYGFKFIGNGSCAYVYKHPDENVVLKICYADGDQIRYWKNYCISELNKPFFLDYLHRSEDEYCAIQKFVDCSKEAQTKAMAIINKTNPFNKHYRNMGIDGDNAVIIDHD